jgi:hypothetical protein
MTPRRTLTAVAAVLACAVLCGSPAHAQAPKSLTPGAAGLSAAITAFDAAMARQAKIDKAQEVKDQAAFAATADSLANLTKEEINATVRPQAEAELRGNPEVQQAIDAWKPQLAAVHKICMRHLTGYGSGETFEPLFKPTCAENEQELDAATLAVAMVFAVRQTREDLWAIEAAKHARTQP